MSAVGGMLGVAKRPALGMTSKLRQRVLFYGPMSVTTTDAVGVGSKTPTFTRGTVAQYINASGLIAQAASGVARFETNGYLTEGASTNEVFSSDQMGVGGAGAWLIFNFTATNNDATSPDNLTRATKDVETAANDFHVDIGNNDVTFTKGANDVIWCSVYAKYRDRQFIYLQVDIGTVGTGVRAFFDIKNGLLGSTANLGTGWTYTAGTQKITAVSGLAGWYRCEFAMTSGSGTVGRFFCGNSTDGSAVQYVGDTTQGGWFWGAMCVVGQTVPSSLVITTSARLARNADVLTYPAAGNLPATGPGTVLLDADVNSTGTSMVLLDTRNTGNQQGIQMGMDSSGNPTADMFTTTSQAPITSSGDAFTVGQRKRVGMAFDTNDVELVTSGTSRGTDTSATLPSSHTAITVGSNGANSVPMYGHVWELLVFGERLSALDMRLLQMASR